MFTSDETSWRIILSGFQTRPAQAAVVFASYLLQRLGAEFDFAAPTTIQVDLTGESLTARRTLLWAVEGRQNARE